MPVAGEPDDSRPQPPAPPATGRSLSPACADNGKRVANGFKRLAITSTKAYLGFVGIGAAIKLARNPGDLRADALQFVKAAFTGTARADSLEVQQGRDLVLKTYGALIDTTKQCVHPVVTFVPALKKPGNGPQTSGLFIAGTSPGEPVASAGRTGTAANGTHAHHAARRFPGNVATRVQSGELRFTTYNLYLPQIAVHEYLHCYTHPNFMNALTDTRLDAQLRHDLVEGTTQYLALQTSFDRRGDRSGKYSGIYLNEVKFIGRIKDAVGIDTLKKAYFSGDSKAIGKVWEAATAHAEIPLRG